MNVQTPVERCEPCSFLKVDNPSVARTGMDGTPVCRWHYQQGNSWSQKPPMDITERLEHFHLHGDLDEYSSEVLYRAKQEIERLRAAIDEAWNELVQGGKYRAGKARVALSKVVGRGR